MDQKYILFGKQSGTCWGANYTQVPSGAIAVTHDQAKRAPAMEAALERVVFEAVNGSITETTLEQCRRAVGE